MKLTQERESYIREHVEKYYHPTSPQLELLAGFDALKHENASLCADFIASTNEHSRFMNEVCDRIKALDAENNKLRQALTRARDQLAMYKAYYTVQKCDEALAK